MKLMLTTALAATLALPTATMAQDLKPITVAVGTTAMTVGYSFLTLAKTLGYWEEEGLDVTIEPVGASLQAAQLMIAGNADFAQINGSVVVQSNVTNNLPLRFVMNNTVTDWNIAVPADSDIEAVTDIAGKTIGVFSLATGGVALLNSYMIENGMDPEADIDMIPLGLGAAPVQALTNGDVDGLLYWGAATVAFENQGLDLRRIAPEDWAEIPDYSLATMEATEEEDPETLIGMVRGMAKAEVFAIANPECAVLLHWANYPDTKPTGADDETVMAWEMNSINFSVDNMKQAFELNGGEYYGAIDPAGVGRLQDFLSGSGVIEGEMPVEDLIVGIPDFYATANDFDADAIRASAEACEFDL
ncbi:MAG: ABC transporter substrate-binding protein [Pseudomonadota bacterium]|nr:ABC transporter substrate-binding protein [Pseudomonadota bacterium]